MRAGFGRSNHVNNDLLYRFEYHSSVQSLKTISLLHQSASDGEGRIPSGHHHQSQSFYHSKVQWVRRLDFGHVLRNTVQYSGAP
jgi:hypothetical protein